MPITKTMAYKVGDDVYHTLEDAQVAALSELVGEQSEVTPTQVHFIIRCLVNNHIKEIVEILSEEIEDEKPTRKPRKDKGSKRAKVIPSPNAPSPYETPPAPQGEAQAAIEAIKG